MPVSRPQYPEKLADALADIGFVTFCTLNPPQNPFPEADAVALNNVDAPAGKAHVTANPDAISVNRKL